MSRKKASILQDYEEECWCKECGSADNLEEHHIFGGANRRISEREGFKILLCAQHHRHGRDSVHQSRVAADKWRAAAQAKYEETHSRAEFMTLIGMNFL